jgi:hypothetical protein
MQEDALAVSGYVFGLARATWGGSAKAFGLKNAGIGAWSEGHWLVN